jgi:Protein of unknown function (DUF3224)
MNLDAGKAALAGCRRSRRPIVYGTAGRLLGFLKRPQPAQRGAATGLPIDHALDMTTHLEAPFTMDTWDAVADEPPPEGGPATARVVLAKTYTGPVLVAAAAGHALTTRGPGGASYVAQERIVGTLDGREGSFVLEHRASMGEGHPTVMKADVVPGSGTGALTGITGSGKVAHELLTLDFELPSAAR